MKKTWDLLRLDVRAFAREGATLTGHTTWAELPRLQAEQIEGVSGPTSTAAQWCITGETKALRGGAHQTWLRVQAQASLRLVCQRCLEPMDQLLQVDRPFRFVSSEQAAMDQDDESDEDLLVAQQAFDALVLIEDELLLALPLVPRHPDCPTPA